VISGAWEGLNYRGNENSGVKDAQGKSPRPVGEKKTLRTRVCKRKTCAETREKEGSGRGREGGGLPPRRSREALAHEKRSHSPPYYAQQKKQKGGADPGMVPFDPPTPEKKTH